MVSTRIRGLVALVVALAAGCVSGPYYRGGPTSEQPHAVISPGDGVTIWRVDGAPTTTRSFSLLVAPGLRALGIRIDHPIESEAAKPYDKATLRLDVVDGGVYLLERAPGEDPPYSVRVRKQLPQE